ncbi:MAG: N-6 DNA methylase [Nanoarchaeota archaeon]|nr:N-6 DNA methylase [Nanoarchaeota archaeon]
MFNCEWQEKDWWKNTLFEQLGYKDYLEKFALLWLLSKEGTINDDLEKYAASKGKRVPRMPIDKELLSKLLQYRMKLSKEISKISKYNETEIDELVQRLLIRLLFIRNCEDRGFETKYKLLSIVEGFKTHKRGLSKFLRAVFDYYNSRYNGSIFKEAEIDKIRFDEKLLAEIIEGLYYTADRLKYNFNIIPADVMGSLYEQYLGHILKKTPQSAKLKEGKVHRKEQGIYYTPTYIVDYIVRNTLGELLKGKKVDASKIRVLDPACGSGSFLVKAFDVLNEHYAKDKESYGQKTLAGNDITYSAKERILKNNIFGVDLDKQAAEIARLNLLLRIAAQEQKLPLLEQNIKIGNSLIDDEKVVGDKAFKWEEQFKEIMDKEGFDVIIGNPPYVDIKQLDPKIVRHFFNKYSTVENRMNLYAVFVEKALSLLKEGGYFGFIIPNSILYNESYTKLRELLLKSVAFKKIVRLPDNIFENVKVETIILIYQKKKEDSKKENCEVFIYPRDVTISSISKENCNQVLYFNQNAWNKSDSKTINISTSKLFNKLLDKIEEQTKPLIELCDFSLGLTPYDKYKGHTKKQIEERVFHSVTKKNETFKPLLSGANIIRYGIFWDKKEYISYGGWLGASREQRFFTKPRIIVRQIISGKPLRIYTGYTEEEFYNAQIGFNILVKDENIVLTKYILAILNSMLMNFYHKEKYLDPSKNLFQKILIANAKKFPIKVIPLSEQKKIILLVDRMLSLNKRLNEIGDKQTDERARLEEEIKKTDAEIDELVYKIYGITEKEKKIIEESLK